MKKITLFLAAMAITLNVAATDFPTAYLSGFGFEWMGAGYLLETPTGKTANAYYLGPQFIADMSDDDFTTSFDDIWLDIITEDAYELSDVSAAGNTYKQGVDHDFAGFKAGYDDENIYIFINYIDDEVPPAGTDVEQIELGISPYFRLETYGATPSVQSEDFNGPAPAVEYFRFIELGAYKITASLGGSLLSVMKVSVVDRSCVDGISPFEIFVNSHTDARNPSDIRLVVTIPLRSLTNELAGDDYFTLQDWLTVNDGQGISLDLKVEDIDRGDTVDPRFYWWSCPPNSPQEGDLSYYSTSSSGMLKAVPVISNESADAQPSNIKVTSDMILLTNPANVKIYSAASGALILNVANETKVLTSGLAAGIYIVEANGEVAKFAK